MGVGSTRSRADNPRVVKLDDNTRGIIMPDGRRTRGDKCEDCGLYGYEAQSCSCDKFQWDGTEQRRVNEDAATNHRGDDIRPNTEQLQ
jgi:hypothetical protein